MFVFECESCGERQYSASADASAPCVYCQTGTVVRIEADRPVADRCAAVEQVAGGKARTESSI